MMSSNILSLSVSALLSFVVVLVQPGTGLTRLISGHLRHHVNDVDF
jgi:hypothetical protein